MNPEKPGSPGKKVMLWAGVLTCAALAGNAMGVTLFYGVDLIFGSIAVILALYYLGWTAGVLVCALSAAYTVYLWGHAFALVIFLAEALLLGYCICRRKKANLVGCAICFWVMVGMPLGFVCYRYFLGVPVDTVLLIIMKQAANGIFNALIAFGLILARSAWQAKTTATKGHGFPVQALLAFVMTAMVLIPSLGAVTVHNRLAAARLPQEARAQAHEAAERVVNAVALFLAEQKEGIREFFEVSQASRISSVLPHTVFSAFWLGPETGGGPLGLGRGTDVPPGKDQMTRWLGEGRDRVFWADCDGAGPGPCLGMFLPTQEPGTAVIAKILAKDIETLVSALTDTGVSIRLSAPPENSSEQARPDRSGPPGDTEHGAKGLLEAPSPGLMPELLRWQRAKWHEYRQVPGTEDLYIHLYISFEPLIAGLQQQFFRTFTLVLFPVLFMMLFIPMASQVLTGPLGQLADFAGQYHPEGARDFAALSARNSMVQEIRQLSERFGDMLLSIEREQEARLALNRELKASEYQVKQVFDISEDAIITINEAQEITAFNRGAENIFGYPAASVLGRSVQILMPERYRERHHAHVRSFQKGPAPSMKLGPDRRLTGLTRAGGEIILESTMTRVHTPGGMLFTAMLRDVTFQIQKEERLERQGQMLAELSGNPSLFTLDPLPTIQQILSKACKVLDAPIAGVWVLDEERRSLGCRCLFHARDQACLKGRTWEKEAFPELFEAVDQGHLIGVKLPVGMDSGAWPGQVPLTCVPFHVGGALSGMLCLGHRTAPRSLYGDEVNFGLVLANLVSLAMEISGHWQTTSKLRQARNDLVRIIDTANAPIFGIDTQGRITEWNAAAERITGYGRKGVMGQDLVENFIAGGFRASVRQVLDKALAGEATANFEFPLYGRDGEKVLILLNATPRRDDAGRISGVVGVGQDITELSAYRENLENLVKAQTRELERALEETEEARQRTDGILRSVAEGLIVIDPEDRVVLMNRSAQAALNLPLEQVVNQSVEVAFKKTNLAGNVAKTLGSVQENFDFEISGSQGNPVQIMRGRSSSVVDQGRGDRVITFSDVTRERELDRMKTEFISTAAHELRTPLTSILGFSELILVDPDMSESERNRFLGFINDQALSLSAIISDLLDISRIEAGKGFSLARAHYPAREILEEVRMYFEGICKGHRLELCLPDPDVTLFVDRQKMGQVLKNLVSNAVKYSPDGGTIRVAGMETGGGFEIRVSDQGKGMTREQISRAFDKFYRVDASDTAVGGTGLGLSIVRHIAEAHDGEVWIDSTPGQSTCVTVFLRKGESFNRPGQPNAPQEKEGIPGPASRTGAGGG